MPKHRRPLVAVFVALAVIGAACGGDDSDDGASAASAPATSGASSATSASSGTAPASSMAANTATDVGVSADEINIAQIVSMTGPNASGEVGFEKGFEAYIEYLNERGGVHGRTINLTSTRDDASDPARQIEEFRRTVESEDPFLMVIASGNLGSAELAIQEGIPIIGPAYSPPWHSSDSFIGITPGSWKAKDPNNLPDAPPGLGGNANAYIARKLGVTKVGSFGYPVSADPARDSCEGMADFGLECVYVDTSLQFGFTDIGASIGAIRESGAKFFTVLMDLGGCVTILRSFKRAGMNDVHVSCVIGYGSAPLEEFVDVMDYAFFVVGTAPFESELPEMRAYIENLTSRKPGTEPDTNTLVGWMTGIFLEDALTELGPEVTRTGFVEMVRNDDAFSAWDAHGLKDPIDYTTNQWEAYENGTARAAGECGGYLLRVDTKNRMWVQVGEKPKLCLRQINTPEALEAKVAADRSSLEVPS